MRPSIIVLILFFISSCASTKAPAFEIQVNESKANFSNSASIEVRVITSDGKPLEGLIVKLLDSNIQSQTNHLGIATIKIADPLFKDRLEILSATIPIDLKGHDRIIAIVVE